MTSCSGRVAAVGLCPSRNFTIPITPSSSRFSVNKGRIPKRAINRIVIGADSADSVRQPSTTADDRSQQTGINTVNSEVSTSGRTSGSGSDTTIGQASHAPTAPVPVISSNDPYLTPTQSWGGDEVPGSKQPKDTEKSKPKSGLAMRVIFGLLMGAAGASAVLVKPLFLLAATFVAYHATIGEQPAMMGCLPCHGTIHVDCARMLRALMCTWW